MIAIGVIFGGPGQSMSRIGVLLGTTMEALARERGPWVGDDDFGPGSPRPTSGRFFEEGSTPGINVLFLVPGSIWKHDHVKKDIGAIRFTRKQKMLLINVLVPEEMVRTGGSVEFVIDALHKANAIARDVFSKKHVGPFDFDAAESLVNRVAHALSQQDL